MPRKKKKTVPGTIYTKVSGSTGKGYLYYRLPGSRKQISTGLEDTPVHYNIVVDILKHCYKQTLRGRELLPEESRETHLTINEAKDRFFDNLRKKGRTKQTLRMYKYAIETIVSPDSAIMLREKGVIDNKSAFSLEVLADEYVMTTIHTLVTKATIMRHYQCFINYCYKNGWLARSINIRKRYNLKTGGHVRDAYMDDEVRQIFIKALFRLPRDYEFPLLILFLRYTGFRIQESLRLYWSDIDIDRKVIVVANKMDTARRDVFPIYHKLNKLLLVLKRLSIQRYRNQDKVFRWEPTSTSVLNKRLAGIEESLGIKKGMRAFHGFRRTFINALIDNGESVYNVQELARHGNIQTTITHYKSRNPNKLIDIMDTMSNQ